MQDAIKADTQHVGGALGALADRHNVYPTAGSKKLFLYRSIAAYAIISKIGEVVIKDDVNADAFIRYQTAVAVDLNDLSGHIYGPVAEMNACQTLSSADCNNYPQLFETDIPKLEEHMLRLAIAALPREQGARFLSSVTSGNLLSVASSAWSLAKASLLAAHNGAAVRRAEREIFAILNCDQPAGINSIESAVTCLDNANAAGNAVKINARKDNVDKGDNVSLARENLDRLDGASVFRPFYLLAKFSCWQLPLGGSPTDLDERRRNRRVSCATIEWAPNWSSRYVIPRPPAN